jgi:uncharacterized membrane protein YheB (UPF0754 family)
LFKDADAGSGAQISGFLESYVESNFNFIADGLKNSLYKYLSANRREFENEIKRNIDGGRGLLPSLAYAAAGGDDLLKAIVSDLIDVQIPIFIEEKYEELKKAARRLFEELIALFREIEPAYIDRESLIQFIREICGDGELIFDLSRLIADVVSGLFSGVRKIDIMRTAGIDTTEKLMTAADIIIRNVSGALAESVRVEAEDLSAEIASFATQLMLGMGGRLTLSELLKGYSESDLSVFKKCVLDAIYGSGLTEAATGLLKHSFFDDDIYAGIITGTVDGILKEIAEDSGIGDELELDGLADNIADSIIRDMETGLPQLLKTLNLKEIAREQINAMDTLKIEQMFRTMGGSYIKRLKLYGLWGGIFGFHYILPLISFIGAGIAKIKALWQSHK